jgi:hypothetical protein
MKKLSLVQSIAIQTVLWTIWYSIKSFGLFVYWSETPKLPMLYNHLSIIVIFYAVYFLSQSRFKLMYYIDFKEFTITQKAKYLFFNRNVAGILAVMFGYVFASWYVDYYVFHLEYPSKLLYFNGRLSKAMEYIPIAIGCSFFFEYAKRQNIRHWVNETRIFSLQDYIEKQHTEQMDALETIKNEYNNVNKANNL